MDTAERGKVTGLGTAARSSHWGTNSGATTIQAVGFGISQASTDVSSKLFFGIDVEGKRQKRLKCLAQSGTHRYFMCFLKGMLMPWHARQLTVLTLQSWF